MHKLVFTFLLMYYFSSINAQSINPTILNKTWNAQWIEMPGTKPNDFGVYHFRKTFMLDELPKQFIVHVSADNRYKLYVNGEEVAFGPAKSDLYHWNFETIDIAAHLTKGKNTIAALVWNFGEDKPVWQISYRTAFILQGDTKAEEILNTDDSWKCTQDKAYSPLIPQLIYTYYAAGATEKVDMNLYDDNWTATNFDDEKWLNAHELFVGVPKNVNHWSTGWMLVPRQIPLMEMTQQRLQKVRDTKNIKVDSNFLQGSHAIKNSGAYNCAYFV